MIIEDNFDGPMYERNQLRIKWTATNLDNFDECFMNLIVFLKIYSLFHGPGVSCKYYKHIYWGLGVPKIIVVTEVHKHEIPEVPKIRDDYNAFTWMIDATSTQMEQIHVVGFAIYYRRSKLLL